jgi:hypothetical protein
VLRERIVDGGAGGLHGVVGRADTEGGCAFPVGEGMACGAARRRGSAYCAHHHALCHVAEGSAGERRRLRESEILATAVGGRQGSRFRLPPDPFVWRLERLTRVFSRPKCSRIVREGDK